jgi:hypothetical protein
MICGMAYCGVVCLGAVKIQNMESRTWGFVSGAMAIVPVTTGGILLVTLILIEFLLAMIMDDMEFIYNVEMIWIVVVCLAAAVAGGMVIMTLLRQEVVDGFEYKPD